METLKLKKLSNIETEPDFSSESSRHIIVEDGGELKRLDYSAFSSAPFIVTFSGTDANNDAACDKTYAEIKAAYDAGEEIKLMYQTGDASHYYDLNKYIFVASDTNISFDGNYLDIQNMADISSGYCNIRCSISNNILHCTFNEV